MKKFNTKQATRTRDGFLQTEAKRSTVAGRPTKIVATLLCGNAEVIVEAAIRSIIDWVDEICLIDTGVTDGTLDRVVAIAGGKMSRSTFKWCNDFARARNAAIEVAERANATWALTIDTDERLEFTAYKNKQQLVQVLESDPKIIAWMVPSRDGCYNKERFLRIPTDVRWEGRTHEALVGAKNGERLLMAGCHFWETPKSPPEFQHKSERDLNILLDETAAQPLNPRWWYYLGQTYEGLKQYRQAIDAFDKCIRLDGWPDESSWASYTAARCWVALEEYRKAEEYCGLGMARKPSVPELPWLAGWCCFKRGAWTDAVTWSTLAIMLAKEKVDCRAAAFRYLPAWYEAPYDVLRFTYVCLNAPELANQAELDFEFAKAARLNSLSSAKNH